MTAPRKIPFGRPWIEQDEVDAAISVLKGDILTHGPQSHAFEAEFAEFIGDGAHCLTTSSGMAALHLAYWQLGIGVGDEVIVPAQTHVATVHAVEFVGAKPVFIDCESDTGNINPFLLEEVITENTKAIGIVHFNGIPCKMHQIMGIARKYNLKVIEDCALAVGARQNGTHVGMFGDAAIFSFYPVKHITTGDGGMFLTKHPELAKLVDKARAFGVDRTFSQRGIPGLYDVPTLGINYRMSDINAAIGRVQLRKIDEIQNRRKRNNKIIVDIVSRLKNILIIQSLDKADECAHYCLSIVLTNKLREKRNEIIGKLNNAGVGTSIYYPHPVPRLQYYREKYNNDLSGYQNAVVISDASIALPVAPHINPEDAEYIGNTFAKVIEEYNVR